MDGLPFRADCVATMRLPAWERSNGVESANSSYDKAEHAGVNRLPDVLANCGWEWSLRVSGGVSLHAGFGAHARSVEGIAPETTVPARRRRHWCPAKSTRESSRYWYCPCLRRLYATGRSPISLLCPGNSSWGFRAANRKFQRITKTGRQTK